jgi:hypothetical protein
MNSKRQMLFVKQKHRERCAASYIIIKTSYVR